MFSKLQSIKQAPTSQSNFLCPNLYLSSRHQLHRDTSNPSMLLSLWNDESKLFSSSFLSFILMMPLLHTPTTNMTCQDIWTTHKYLNICFQLASNLQQFVACNVMIFSEARCSFEGQQWSSNLKYVKRKKHVVIDTSRYNNNNNGTFLTLIILFPINLLKKTELFYILDYLLELMIKMWWFGFFLIKDLTSKSSKLGGPFFPWKNPFKVLYRLKSYVYPIFSSKFNKTSPKNILQKRFWVFFK